MAKEGFLKNLRGARRGTAGGPSGLTMDHLKVLLEDCAACELLLAAAQELAQAEAPDAIVAAMRLGRLTVLQKPQGASVALLRATR